MKLKRNEILNQQNHKCFFYFLATAFIIRLIIAPIIEGHPTDIQCFKSWASHAAEYGLSNFYATDMFVDYPPGYIYILYIIGKIRMIFSLDYNSTTYLVLIKLPAMIADVIASWLIYKLALKKSSQNSAILLSTVYAFNPAIIINSSVWGQVDGVFVLFILLYLMFLTDEKFIISVIMLVIAVLIKPQALIFTPLLLFKLINILIDNHNWDMVKSLLISGCCGLGVFIIGILPFSLVQGPFWIIKLYKETLSSYPYATLNAFNLFALTGGNWQSENLNLLFFTYKTWGYIFITVIVIVAAILYYKNKVLKNTYFIASFIMTAVFMLSSKMHERYLFPALILLLAAYVLSKDKQILWLYAGLSFTHFLNVAYVLENNLKETYHIPPYDETLIFVSVFNMALFIYMIKVSVDICLNKGVGDKI